ncbi:DAK2 domain-containing protein [Nocardioides houyundeii]|uniref:DAK2 domain-containing protein n=1 Tax=Nocardioides houyundeii TaxID=2045452 RepID=UPI000DF37529|nr:DAK2 domain-containing protein [Nocardioides houyundeii]
MEQVPQGISLDTVLRFVDIATDALSSAREEIDALNVYPVPDGDTGTNMFLTFSAARDAIREAAMAGGDLGAALAAFRHAALLGARGNSGVILSQMLGAMSVRIERAAASESYALVMADALRVATDASYAAVGQPVEGTILTVARAASDAAQHVVATGKDLRARDIFSAAAAAARAALARTPQQLKVLADAGVVDAGGRGLSVVLDAADTVLTGRIPVTTSARIGLPRIPMPVPDGDLTPDGPAYEVMYLLEADEPAVATLRKTLAPLGDSLVVVGGEGLWNVHVHVHDVGAAIEAGLDAGRPYRVRVTHFAEQVVEARRRRSDRTGRRIVAVAAGTGLAELFRSAGAVVVEAGPGRRPSTGQILEAIESSGGAEIILLPNDPDSVRVAEIAARTAEESGAARVAIIPTHAQVQGLAALAVHEPGRSFDSDVLEMTATARHARHGAITVAARRAITMAGPCEPGDVLGVIEGDFAVVGEEQYSVATSVLDRLLGAGGELATIVAGREEGARDLAARCAEFLERAHPHVDVVVYDGGQERYPLLMCVE